jgi:hypothetical protein
MGNIFLGYFLKKRGEKKEKREFQKQSYATGAASTISLAV